MRGRGASRSASQARSMSSALQRARPQMTGPATWRAMACTASKSPGEAIGKPASMMSTPRSLSARATSSFSARFMLAPGDCSPSRSVVSKMIRRSLADMVTLRKRSDPISIRETKKPWNLKVPGPKSVQFLALTAYPKTCPPQGGEEGPELVSPVGTPWLDPHRNSADKPVQIV